VYRLQLQNLIAPSNTLDGLTFALTVNGEERGQATSQGGVITFDAVVDDADEVGLRLVPPPR
jgi:hypothetical protein